MNTLEQLFSLIKSRQNEMPEDSYTAKLFASGMERVAKKVGEEATEVAIAGMKNNKAEITYEMADLWYHCLVLLALSDLKPEDIYSELEKRLIK